MFPRWLTWLFLLALVYMIYTVGETRRAVEAPVVTKDATPLVESEAYKGLAEATDVEAWKRRIDPDYAATNNCRIDAPADKAALALKVIEDAAGEGEGAACGQTIAITLTVWNSSGGKAYTGKLNLALGSRELASGLDFGLLGIKPGGVRTLILPSYARIHMKSHPAQATMVALRKQMAGNNIAMVTVTREN